MRTEPKTLSESASLEKGSNNYFQDNWSPSPALHACLGYETSSIVLQIIGPAQDWVWRAACSRGMAQGTVSAWGSNANGQLGNGADAVSNTPCYFASAAFGPQAHCSNIPVAVSGLTGVATVFGGSLPENSLALKSDGTVWAWGQNNYGQLGNGTTPDSNTPVAVSNLAGVVAISCGYWHSLAVKSDGTVWGWESNFWGQLGNGTIFVNANTPGPVSGLTGVVGIGGGLIHSLALKSDGTVRAWGHNSYGELGNCTNTNSNVPVQVRGLAGVTAIAGAGQHSLALGNPPLLGACSIDSTPPVILAGFFRGFRSFFTCGVEWSPGYELGFPCRPTQ